MTLSRKIRLDVFYLSEACDMYDFDTVIDRRNGDSIKWKVAENELPMWVADMDSGLPPKFWMRSKAAWIMAFSGMRMFPTPGTMLTSIGGVGGIT